jgi:dienelactone hydrolase
VKLVLACGVALVLAAARADAQPPASPTTAVLYSSGTQARLRARLDSLARAIGPTAPAEAGQALHYRGESFERGGQRDSAIACYQRALELRGDHEDRLSLADALLRRHRGRDASTALGVLKPGMTSLQGESGELGLAYQARSGWATFLAGDTASALAQLKPLETRLSRSQEWRYRLARVTLAAGDPHHAYDLLLPLLMASRHQDPELVDMLNTIGTQTGRGSALDGDLARNLGARDQIERAAITSMGGRRVTFPASDGAYLGAVIVADAGTAKRRAAIVLVAPGDTIADYDTLSVSLKRAGFAVMLVDVRGSGASVSPMCALPDTWEGRQHALAERVAHDVRDALRALRTAILIDSTRVVAIGVGATVPIVIQAAEIERRIAALVLVSPSVPEVERGETLARVRGLQRPTFFQVGPEDQLASGAMIDSLFQASPRGTSRLADARAVGSGVRQFGSDPKITPRLVGWINETIPASGSASRAASATRPK